MQDPRADNCRAFQVDHDGKVVSVQLDVLSMPTGRWRLHHVRLIDEYEAGGRIVTTVNVLGKNNMPMLAPVALAWPYGGGPRFANWVYPNSTEVPVVHVTANKYFPPDRGPLAIFVGENGTPDSDIVGGLGLPLGHHVAYMMTYVERSSDAPPEPQPPDGGSSRPSDGTESTVLAVLARIESKIDALQAEIDRLLRANQ